MQGFLETPELCDETKRIPSESGLEYCQWDFWPHVPVEASGWVHELVAEHIGVSREYYRRARSAASEAQFRELEKRWREATSSMSLEQHKISHMAYLQIIAMKEDALPFIFQQLLNQRRYWFVALQAITQENPVPSGSTFQDAVAVWLQWGKQHGYV